MSYLEELLPEFRKGAKIRRKDWDKGKYIVCNGNFVDNDLGRVHSLTNLDIIGDVWEFYKEPKPDWDYIIENKCDYSCVVLQNIAKKVTLFWIAFQVRGQRQLHAIT